MTVLKSPLPQNASMLSLTTLRSRQLEALQEILTRRLAEDPALGELTASAEVKSTPAERGVARVEHANLGAALDVLNAYQTKRRAKSSAHVAGRRIGLRWRYKDDPRTWLIEVLKLWIRNNVADTDLSEAKVQNIVGLCRDVISCQGLFPARNQQSFIYTIAEVYKRLQLQLREVLKRTRTCAELAHTAITLSRNLVSDSIAFLLVAATDLKQTDRLPSLETVALWEALPAESHPLPGAMDAQLQRAMQDAWRTQCGQLVAALLGSPWCIRLFGGGGQALGSPRAGGKSIADSLASAAGESADSVQMLVETARAEFDKGNFRNSGLAGAFRTADSADVRQNYLAAAEMVFDLTYLIGDALVQFSRISEGLGDYGMIRAAPWLHPFLEALVEKVQKLKLTLEQLSEKIDQKTVLRKARGEAVPKPAPSEAMCQRALVAVGRAVKRGDSHAALLLKALQELRSQSAPKRLPELKESLNDIVVQLDLILSSPDFRARVGDGFPELPLLCAGGSASPGHAPATAFVALTDVEAPSEAPVIVEVYEPDLGASLAAARCADLDAEATGPEARTFGAQGRERVELPDAALQPACCVRAASAASPMAAATGALAAGRIVEVCRLTGPYPGFGWRRHDRRALRLQAGLLAIFDRGSMVRVKTEVDLAHAVDDCTRVSERIVRLGMRRPAKGCDGVEEHKSYVFEFPSASYADEFEDHVLRAQCLITAAGARQSA